MSRRWGFIPLIRCFGYKSFDKIGKVQTILTVTLLQYSHSMDRTHVFFEIFARGILMLAPCTVLTNMIWKYDGFEIFIDILKFYSWVKIPKNLNLLWNLETRDRQRNLAKGIWKKSYLQIQFTQHFGIFHIHQKWSKRDIVLKKLSPSILTSHVFWPNLSGWFK